MQTETDSQSNVLMFLLYKIRFNLLTNQKKCWLTAIVRKMPNFSTREMRILNRFGFECAKICSEYVNFISITIVAVT